MDFFLRCNSLSCRAELNDRAVVTTCSHIFCVPCSQKLRLSSSDGDRICPACETLLPNPDDAVSTVLNPTEDYKTSVLSGLSPTIIMECASRGLSFWSYQSSQEILYQQFLGGKVREKYDDLRSQLDKVTRDANSEIGDLQNKLSATQITQNDLQKKNHELAEALREKTRKHNQMQELYNKLKRRTLYSRAQTAASEAVDQSLPGNANRIREHMSSMQNSQHFRAPLSPQRHYVDRVLPGERAIFGQPRRPEVNLRESGVGLNLPTSTTSQHRQPLPAPRPIRPSVSNLSSLPRTAGYGFNASPSRRQPMSVQTPSNSGLTGYGMSAGMKVSR